jgi:hypothetical protein
MADLPVEPKPRCCVIGAPAGFEAVAGAVVGLVALLSSQDHITLPFRVVSVQQ